jgi:hypothetical protein
MGFWLKYTDRLETVPAPESSGIVRKRGEILNFFWGDFSGKIEIIVPGISDFICIVCK